MAADKLSDIQKIKRSGPMIPRSLRSRVSQFVFDHLLLWVLIVMVVMVLAIVFSSPKGTIFYNGEGSLQWPRA